MEVLSLPSAAAAAGPPPAPADLCSLFPPMPAPEAASAASSGDCSLASSCSADLAQVQQQVQQQAAVQQQQQQACAADAVPPEQRTHHLLKHCLSQSQRGAALQHFNTSDPREAAKEIARMGQRELQAKFREVYGSATKSNNNSWLRRKLYEAVGVAPLKANTKGKARKSAASAQRKSGGSKDRSPKGASKAKQGGAAAHLPASPAGHHAASLGLLGASMGSGMSILDLHQHSGLLSADTSDSEDGCASHGNFTSGLHSTPDSPRSPLGRHCHRHGLAPFSSACSPLFGAVTQQPAAAAGGQPLPPLPPAPAGFVPLAEPQSPLAAGLHWADGAAHAAFGSAATCGAQQQQAAPRLAQQAPSCFLSAGSAALPLPPLDASDPLSLAHMGPASHTTCHTHHTFNPMDLEQDAAQLWEGGPSQPWYFGSSMSMELASLGSLGAGMGAPSSASAASAALPLPIPMPMDSSDATGTCCGTCCGCEQEDDDIPLLTLDLGAIDVSI